MWSQFYSADSLSPHYTVYFNTIILPSLRCLKCSFPAKFPDYDFVSIVFFSHTFYTFILSHTMHCLSKNSPNCEELCHVIFGHLIVSSLLDSSSTFICSHRAAVCVQTCFRPILNKGQQSKNTNNWFSFQVTKLE